MTQPRRVNPFRITIGLDTAKLTGPTADAKLGAVEPDLDDWEAGRKQPTPGQLDRLARMSGFPVEFFYLANDVEPQVLVARVCGTRRSSSIIVTLLHPPPPPQGELF